MPNNSNHASSQTPRAAHEIIEAARAEMNQRARANQDAITNAFQEMVTRLSMANVIDPNANTPIVNGARPPHAPAGNATTSNTASASSRPRAAPIAGPTMIVNGVDARGWGKDVNEHTRTAEAGTRGMESLAIVTCEDPVSEYDEANMKNDICAPRSVMSTPPVLPSETHDDSQAGNTKPSDDEDDPERHGWSDHGYLLAPSAFIGPRMFETEEPCNVDEIYRWESWILRRLVKESMPEITDNIIAKKLNAEWYRAFLRADEADKVAREADMAKEVNGSQPRGSMVEMPDVEATRFSKTESE
jgi:hypothetical protein